MTCIDTKKEGEQPPEGFYVEGEARYSTEADCLDACAEGACCETDGSCNIKPQCECDTENGAVFAGVGGTCAACAPCGCEGLEGWPETLSLELLEFSELVNEGFFGGPPGHLGELPESCISAAATELAAEFNRNASINLTRESVSLDKQSCKYSLRRLTQGPGLGLCEVTGGPFYYSVYFIANVTVACDRVDVAVAVQISTPECEFTIDLSTGQWVTPGIVQHSARGSSPFSCEALSSGLEFPAAYAQRVGPTAHDGGCGASSFLYSVSSPSGMKFRVSFDNPLP